MHSSLIGKIEKAQRYEHEPERVTIQHLQADFKGEHDVLVASIPAMARAAIRWPSSAY